VIDLVVQRRIVPEYLGTRSGRIDLVIVVLTFPYYLIPGASGYTAILLVARLARVARLALATKGLRRFAARLGSVVSAAALVLLIASLVAYGAEHPKNPEFAIRRCTVVGDRDADDGRLRGYRPDHDDRSTRRRLDHVHRRRGARCARGIAGRAVPPRPACGGERCASLPPVVQELASLREELQSFDERLSRLIDQVEADTA